MPYRIRADESIDEAIRRIASEQIDRAAEEATCANLSAAEAIHKVRKRCKQIRSLLRLVRPKLGDVYAVENAWYRDAAARLSDIRDAQVVSDTFDKLLAYFNKYSYANEFSDITLCLRARRTAVAQSEADEVRTGLKRFSQAMEEGRARIAAWPVNDDGFNVIRLGLKKSYSGGRREMLHASADPSAEAIHEWRKRVKDHAHHVRLLQDVWKEPMKARRRETETLGDWLGDDHDLEVLRATLPSCREHAGTKSLRTVLAFIDERQGELRAAAMTIGARLYAEKPKAFARRFDGYWSSWRGQHDYDQPVAYLRSA